MVEFNLCLASRVMIFNFRPFKVQTSHCSMFKVHTVTLPSTMYEVQTTVKRFLEVESGRTDVCTRQKP